MVCRRFWHSNGALWDDCEIEIRKVNMYETIRQCPFQELVVPFRYQQGDDLGKSLRLIVTPYKAEKK